MQNLFKIPVILVSMRNRISIFVIVMAISLFPHFAMSEITWTAKVVKIEDCQTFQVEVYRQRVPVRLAGLTCAMAMPDQKNEMVDFLKNLLLPSSRRKAPSFRWGI